MIRRTKRMRSLYGLLSACIVPAFYFQTLAQTTPVEYLEHTSKAARFYNDGRYQESANEYSAAFKTSHWMALPADRLCAARSWAMSHQNDSAFYCLNRLVDRVFYSDDSYLLNQPDFDSLHADERWATLIERVRMNKLLNLGFEAINRDTFSLYRWTYWNGGWNYLIEFDSITKHEGEKSILIHCVQPNANNFQCGSISFNMPFKKSYVGKEVELTSWIKIKNVDSRINLFLSFRDKKDHVILEETLDSRLIHGTIDWKQYSAKLRIPEEAEQIVIGVILWGDGTVWADDFHVFIDGIDIRSKY